MRRIQVDSTVRCLVEDVNPSGKRTIVFVHGWPLSHRIFDYQTAVLPSYDIRCVSYDIRGFGGSDKPWNGYRYDRLAADLHRILEGIDAKSVTLCGFSMGGAICARYMDKYRGYKVKRLVLMGAACPSFVQRPGYPIGMTKEQVDNLIFQAYTDMPQLSKQFGPTCFYSNPSEAFLGWFAGIGEQASVHGAISCLESLRDEDLRSSMGKICVPTAIFHGVHDQVCPFSMAEEMRRTIRNSFIIPFESSGHCLFYDEKDKCNSSLIDFITANV